MVEELRFRVGQKVEVITSDGHYYMEPCVSKRKLQEIMNRLTGYSLYAYEEEFKQGYFTLAGGHRVGIVGHVSRNLDTVSQISGINIRIAHQRKNCSRELVQRIQKGNGIYNTLLLSEPGVGKTTYLRDCIRLLSNRGFKIGVVDERSEIGACVNGTPQNDLGSSTDILDNCPKVRGMKMLLRSMSPQIIAVDELGSREDVEAVRELLYSGVSVLGTVHASSFQEVFEQPYLGPLIKSGAIARLVLLEKKNAKRVYQIYDVENSRNVPCTGEYTGESEWMECSLQTKN